MSIQDLTPLLCGSTLLIENGDTMSIDKDEKESQEKDGKKPKGNKGPKKVTMQPSVQTFGAGKSKRPEYPKNDKVMITDALSDVRIK